MPRREAPDDEDLMARCPRCRGNGTVYDITLNTQTECPVCDGTGRVTPATLRTFQRTGQA